MEILLAISIAINCLLIVALAIQDGLRLGAQYNEKLFKQEMLTKEKLADEWEEKYYKECQNNEQI